MRHKAWKNDLNDISGPLSGDNCERHQAMTMARGDNGGIEVAARVLGEITGPSSQAE